MRLSDINNKTISVTLTDFELAKPDDNTPEKLAERARISIATSKNLISTNTTHPSKVGFLMPKI